MDIRLFPGSVFRVPSVRTLSRGGSGRELMRNLVFLFLFFFLLACSSKGIEQSEPPSRVPGGPRVVAVGDLHGDLGAARAALQLAGAMDQEDHWIGGDLILVQTGDILDRGDDELEIWELFDRLAEEARASGGAIYLLNGNHELMNAYQDFRYVTEGGFLDFRDTPLPSSPDSALLALSPDRQGRAAAFLPGGSAALRMAGQNIALVVGETLFVHGGILPSNLTLGLDSLNAQAREWLRGERPEPEWVRGEESPVWARLYSRQPDPAACDTLCWTLEELELERMVVGHTVQESGITGFCGGRVWAIDVGMADAYGGRPEVLEIREGRVQSLRK